MLNLRFPVILKFGALSIAYNLRIEGIVRLYLNFSAVLVLHNFTFLLKLG